jgi:hypothetical protein
MRSLKSVTLPAAAAAVLCVGASAALANSDGRTSGKIFSPANNDQSASAQVFSDVPPPAPRSFDLRFPYKGITTTPTNVVGVDCQDPANAGLDRCNGMK